MSLDGLTLSIVTGVTCLVFALSTHVLAYLLPQEGHLRDWRLGSLLSAAGATLVAVQGVAPPWLAPMLSNSLLVSGMIPIFRVCSARLQKSKSKDCWNRKTRYI